MAGERRRALLLFRHGFPPEISKPVGRIPVEQWQILRLLRREPAMLDLLPVNSALVFAVALALRGPMGSRLPPEFAKMRQRELGHVFGFPDSEAVVRLFRKVPPEALGEERLAQLRRAVATPETLKVLSHLEGIPASVIALSAEPRLFRSVTPSFLAEVAQEEGPSGEEHAAALLGEALQMQEHLEPGKRVRIDSMARLREWHDDLRRDYDRWVESRAEACKFPPPPVPGLPPVAPLIELGPAQRGPGRNWHSATRSP
jgi:hypothetical protein